MAYPNYDLEKYKKINLMFVAYSCLCLLSAATYHPVSIFFRQSYFPQPYALEWILVLLLQFHSDVDKDSKAGELFKRIHCSYEVLSNEASRAQYDRVLKRQEHSRFHRAERHNYTPEVEEAIKYYYSWSEKRHSSRYERFYEYYSTYPNSHCYSEAESEPQEEEETGQEERDTSLEVLKSAFSSMFLLYTLGCLASLTFSTFTALLDQELDNGYNVGFMIAWILGGKGGILLTLCLTLAIWLGGKPSSSVVVLVVVAMWVGSMLLFYKELFLPSYTCLSSFKLTQPESCVSFTSTSV